MKFYLLLSIILIGIIIYNIIPDINAHNFNTNKDSLFFTLLKRYQVEDFLASENLTTPKVVTIEHSQNAATLLKQIISFNNDTKIAGNFNRFEIAFSNLNLSTKALVAADLADESLKQYGLASGLNEGDASDLKTMSMGMIMNMDRMENHNITENSMRQVLPPDMSMSYDNQSTPTFSNLTGTNLNEVNYGTSIGLARSLMSVFTDNLENATLQNSTGLLQIPMSMKLESVTSLNQGTDNLIQAISSKSSLEHVYSIVHGQIHPNLYLAYNLELKGD